jgi:D-arabinose 1-dehydrogenase-like Zn-dependent alcohol dehydrogenase
MILKPNEPLEIRHMETLTPKGTQVLLKVKGVCYSDIHPWEGGYEGLEG